MATITLLTDYGLEDHYVGVVKGVILNINKEAKIIDISHQVQPHNIKEAAYLLAVSYKYFPKYTIHLVVVDPGVGSARRIILVKTKDYYFISPDNGTLTYALANEQIEKIINVSNKKYFLNNISYTFHGRDIMGPVAAYLSKGVPVEEFGSPIDSFYQLDIEKVQLKHNKLVGKIIHIDKFGNLITNIRREDLEQLHNYQIKIKNEVINKLSYSYQDVDKGKLLAIIGSSNFLEISVNQGDAKKKLNVEEGQEIEVLLG